MSSFKNEYFFIPIGFLLCGIIIGGIMSFICKATVDEISGGQNHADKEILNYIAGNLNAHPILELNPISVSSSETCEAPKAYLSVGSFQGIEKGCHCDSDVYLDSNGDCAGGENYAHCYSPTTIDAVKPGKAKIWKD